MKEQQDPTTQYMMSIIEFPIGSTTGQTLFATQTYSMHQKQTIGMIALYVDPYEALYQYLKKHKLKYADIYEMLNQESYMCLMANRQKEPVFDVDFVALSYSHL